MPDKTQIQIRKAFHQIHNLQIHTRFCRGWSLGQGGRARLVTLMVGENLGPPGRQDPSARYNCGVSMKIMKKVVYRVKVADSRVTESESTFDPVCQLGLCE